MPDWLAVGKAVLDAGGWAAFIGLVLFIGVTGARRKWVFGWIFDRTEQRADKSDTQVDRNSDSIESLSTSVASLATSYDRLERDFNALSGRSVNRE